MGVVGFLVDVAVLLLGEGGLGEEGKQPIEVEWIGILVVIRVLFTQLGIGSCPRPRSRRSCRRPGW